MNEVLLNFDLEEFDLPLEYGEKISKNNQLEFSLKGLKKLVSLLDSQEIKATFFTTASFALKYPEIIKKISKKHEIASHNLIHEGNIYKEEDVRKSKEIIEKIINKKIEGFRMPRLKDVDYLSLSNLGFKYDSSISPTYLPGRYNNYFKSRKLKIFKGITEVPISTTPLIKIPFSWIFFRFFGLVYAKIATNLCIKKPGFVNIFFHPWEFNNLKSFKIPFYIKKNSGDKALNLLKKYILWCKSKGYDFYAIGDFLRKK
jgi:peptidoglycan/xylan/chitin deacetylase (PgdA/CDA1 family)